MKITSNMTDKEVFNMYGILSPARIEKLLYEVDDLQNGIISDKNIEIENLKNIINTLTFNCKEWEKKYENALAMIETYDRRWVAIKEIIDGKEGEEEINEH